ncbi:MAG TPA: hypothetical protein VD997_11575 [Phycisphaerales bacterium]|nr:hypothetical protein [Phycisphaerales bacterium]
MLVELLQPATPDLARRWLGALLLVPREERAAVVASVEARIGALYPLSGTGAEPAAGPAREVEVVQAPVQREGYIEEVRTAYAACPAPQPAGGVLAGALAGRARKGA